MDLFWTLLLCTLGIQSSVQLLPKTVIPLSYDLGLHVDLGDSLLNEFVFSGLVSITIKCLNTTNTITLHSKNLRMSVVHVTHGRNLLNNDGNSQVIVDQKEDLATLLLPANIEKNNDYFVDIFFDGGHFEKVLKEGFFLSSSKNPSTGKTVYNATSYLQNGNARKVFPCFDEPEYKTPFKIVIGHGKKKKAISNMPEDHTEYKKYMGVDWIDTYFKKTAPLSTDQVTFSVFDPPKP